MIDLEKEVQEAFEEMAEKMGMCLNQYWGDSFDNPYENEDTILAYNIFREGAKVKRAETTALQQKLDRYENPDYVLVPRNPSEEMCEAGGDAPSYKMGNLVVKTIFKAMIEAVEKGN